jgi:hypothetical protein
VPSTPPQRSISCYLGTIVLRHAGDKNTGTGTRWGVERDPLNGVTLGAPKTPLYLKHRAGFRGEESRCHLAEEVEDGHSPLLLVRMQNGAAAAENNSGS